MDTPDTRLIEAPARRRRRRHTAQFKAELIKACQQPGVSSAAVALANGINANLVRRWVNAAESASGDVTASTQSHMPKKPSLEFVPLRLASPSVAGPQPAIRIDFQRAGLNVSVAWPTSAAAECASWLREILK